MMALSFALVIFMILLPTDTNQHMLSLAVTVILKFRS